MKFDLRKQYDDVLNEFYHDPATEAEYHDIELGFNAAMVTLVIVAMFSSAVYAMFLRAIVDTRTTQETAAAGRLEHHPPGDLCRIASGSIQDLGLAAFLDGLEKAVGFMKRR